MVSIISQVMGNTTEFERVATLLESSLSFDNDINVSVFETNIRGMSSSNCRSVYDSNPGNIRILIKKHSNKG